MSDFVHFDKVVKTGDWDYQMALPVNANGIYDESEVIYGACNQLPNPVIPEARKPPGNTNC